MKLNGLIMKNVLTILSLISFIIFANPVLAGEYRVYSTGAYEELSKLHRRPGDTKIAGEGIELLVDYSISMRCSINTAKKTLKNILPNLPQSSAIALRVFGESPKDRPEINNVCQSSRLVSSFKKRNHEAIIEGLNEAKVGGGTPLEFALRETIEKDLKYVRVYDANTTFKKKKIIIVTDGEEGCGGDSCAYIREVMRNRDDIQIDVIQIGKSERLRCLTEATGGNFHLVYWQEELFEKAFATALDVPNYSPSTNSNKYKFVNY